MHSRTPIMMRTELEECGNILVTNRPSISLSPWQVAAAAHEEAIIEYCVDGIWSPNTGSKVPLAIWDLLQPLAHRQKKPSCQHLPRCFPVQFKPSRTTVDVISSGHLHCIQTIPCANKETVICPCTGF